MPSPFGSFERHWAHRERNGVQCLDDFFGVLLSSHPSLDGVRDTRCDQVTHIYCLLHRTGKWWDVFVLCPDRLITIERTISRQSGLQAVDSQILSTNPAVDEHRHTLCD